MFFNTWFTKLHLHYKGCKAYIKDGFLIVLAILSLKYLPVKDRNLKLYVGVDLKL